ncbi:MAG: hypothetical protein ACJ748_10135 [Flavisolibacter sp.]
MQVQMSVFYNGYFLSYLIQSDDKENFHFQLKSAPKNAVYSPDNFNASVLNKKWSFSIPLDTEFQKNAISTLKKIIKQDQ